MKRYNFQTEDGEWFPESVRRLTAILAQWLGWAGALALLLFLAVTYKAERPPAYLTMSVIVLLFVGATGTMIRSRHRLMDTIVRAFLLGMEAHNSECKEEE